MDRKAADCSTFPVSPLLLAMGVVVVIRLFIDPLGYADSVIRRAWIVFAVLQFIGIACGMSAELFDRWGAQLWGVSFVGLLPGNILAALLVEGSLWNTGMTLKQIYLLEVPVTVIINGIVWLLFALAFRFVKRARRARQ